MITSTKLVLDFLTGNLFDEVNIKFIPGNLLMANWVQRSRKIDVF